MNKLLIFALILILALGTNAFKKGEKGKSKPKPEVPRPPPEELKVEVLKRPANCKQKSQLGDVLTVHYTGTLKEEGTIFDSSVYRGTPFNFTLGAGQVIPGWERGVNGMCAGEKRKLTVPPYLAYGDQGYPPVIPASATLIFEIELVGINIAPPPSFQPPSGEGGEDIGETVEAATEETD